MGYSCTVDASNALAVVGHFYATNGNPNILTIRGTEYFFERGRENGDGAITGILMESLPGDLCRKVGTVRINPDGSIARFPRIPQRDKVEIENSFRDMSARNPQLLRSWSFGV